MEEETLSDAGFQIVRLFQEVKQIRVITELKIKFPSNRFNVESDRFELWAVNMGLFTTGDASLDDRIKLAEGMRTTLQRFLESLKNSLNEVLQYAEDPHSMSIEEESELGLGFFEDDRSELDLLLDSVKDPIDRLYKVSTWIHNASPGPGHLKAQGEKQIAQAATNSDILLSPTSNSRRKGPTLVDSHEENKVVTDFKHDYSAESPSGLWADSPQEDQGDLKILESPQGENFPGKAGNLDNPQRLVRWKVVEDIRSDDSIPQHVTVHPATTTTIKGLKDPKIRRPPNTAPRSRPITLKPTWVLSPVNTDPFDNMIRIAYELETRQDLDEAEKIYRHCLEAIQVDMGNDHPCSIKVLARLGCLLMMRDEPGAAAKVFRAGLEIISKHEIGESEEKIQIMNNLANALTMIADWPEAEKLYSEGLALSKEYQGDGHENTLTLMSNYGSMLHEQGAFTEAQEILEPCAMLSSQHLGTEHPLYKEAARLLSRAITREYP